MRRKTSILWLFAAIGVLSGCGDSNANTSTTMTQYNGVWDVIGRTDAPPDSDGEDCGYGSGNGTLEISGTKVTGSLTDNSGYLYVLEGSIDGSGKMVGNFTYEGYDAATFQGHLSNTEGSGIFKDIYNCPGAWEVKKRGVMPERIKEGAEAPRVAEPVS